MNLSRLMRFFKCITCSVENDSYFSLSASIKKKNKHGHILSQRLITNIPLVINGSLDHWIIGLLDHWMQKQERINLNSNSNLLKLKCFVYHLSNTNFTSELSDNDDSNFKTNSIFDYLTQIESYDLKEHKCKFVPRSDRDHTRYKGEWGIFV